jgi:hypothetical protein
LALNGFGRFMGAEMMLFPEATDFSGRVLLVRDGLVVPVATGYPVSGSLQLCVGRGKFGRARVFFMRNGKGLASHA